MSREIRRIVAAAAFGLAMTGAASAQVAPPSEPAAKAAFDVLSKHCARCHQDGQLTAREKPAKNFGFVLKLDQLAADPNYVLPGNPLGSKVLTQILNKEMPYDVMYEGASPDISADEIKAVENWITTLGTRTASACDARQFIAGRDMIGVIATDLERMPRARMRGTRYLTLTHLKNACTDEAALNVYRQGAVKLINSLSRSSDVVRLEPIDSAQTILRINLDDLGWSPSDWDLVLGVYPYNTQPDTQLSAVLERATGTRLPYVRADWFAFTAARPSAASPPGIYDKLLRLPATFQALAREQGVDVDGNIRRLTAQRSGFQRSGVSRNNRLIERHPSRSGYFWTSYDFAGNRGLQSLFEHPLGPSGPQAFKHDGGETIYSLPNGFQAYYLNTADGKAIATGPTSIVQDPTSKDLSVTNGISCMGCHDQGMRKAKDEVRAIVVQGRTFPREVREQVEALYPPAERMDRVIVDDAKRFADALVRAGLDPTLKYNGVEMINALAKRYENDVDLNLAAAEFGYTRDQFLDAVKDADRKFRPLIRRLEQGTVPRDQFEVSYVDLANTITDDEIVKLRAQGKPTPPRPVAQAPAYRPPAPTGVAPAITLFSDRNTYRQGETPVFTVVANRDCFLTLIDVDDKNEGTVIFPNRFQQDNRIRAHVQVQLPGPNAGFQFKLKDVGRETVTAVCNSRKNDADGIAHNFTRSAFTSVPNYTGAVAKTRSIAVLQGARDRAIAVEATGQGAPAGAPVAQAGPAPAPPPQDTVRTAITIAVR